MNEMDKHFKRLSSIAEHKTRKILKQREKITEAFIAETGLKPSEIEMVITNVNGDITWYLRKRSNTNITIKEEPNHG